MKALHDEEFSHRTRSNIVAFYEQVSENMISFGKLHLFIGFYIKLKSQITFQFRYIFDSKIILPSYSQSLADLVPLI